MENEAPSPFCKMQNARTKKNMLTLTEMTDCVYVTDSTDWIGFGSVSQWLTGGMGRAANQYGGGANNSEVTSRQFTSCRIVFTILDNIQ